MVVPDRGDVIWIDLNPSKGHEQKGLRPAVVLSPASYNTPTSLLIACPLTRQIKGYPFEVVCIYKGQSAVVLTDQIKSFDWTKRMVNIDGKLTHKTLDNINLKLSALLSIH